VRPGSENQRIVGHLWRGGSLPCPTRPLCYSPTLSRYSQDGSPMTGGRVGVSCGQRSANPAKSLSERQGREEKTGQVPNPLAPSALASLRQVGGARQACEPRQRSSQAALTPEEGAWRCTISPPSPATESSGQAFLLEGSPACDFSCPARKTHSKAHSQTRLAAQTQSPRHRDFSQLQLQPRPHPHR